MPRNLTQLRNSVLWVRRHFASSLFNCDHHFSALLRPSQLFSIFATLFNSSQSCSISPPLTSTLFTSSLLFSTLPNDFHIHSSQLAPTLFTSCHVLNSSHLFSALINCSHLFLSSCLKASHLLNCGRFFSTLVTSCHSVNEMLTEVNWTDFCSAIIFVWCSSIVVIQEVFVRVQRPSTQVQLLFLRRQLNIFNIPPWRWAMQLHASQGTWQPDHVYQLNILNMPPWM